MSDLVAPVVGRPAGGDEVEGPPAPWWIGVGAGAGRAGAVGGRRLGRLGRAADGLTKTVLKTALEAEMDERLGYPPYAIEGRNSGNSRNGARSKTVLTEVGDVTIEVPRDRAGSFEPRIVAKCPRRLAASTSW